MPVVSRNVFERRVAVAGRAGARVASKITACLPSGPSSNLSYRSLDKDLF